MSATLITNIAELVTNSANLGDGSLLGVVTNAALVVDNGYVAWVGNALDEPSCDERIDAQGCAIVPGFVDSHTHLVFAGSRDDEFAARMSGEAYDGGGILKTVSATRAAPEGALRELTKQRALELRQSGVTTVEIKSGYDLTVDGEMRLLRLAGELTSETTFLGAHTVPREYQGRRDEYVSLVANEMLTSCAPLAKWADVFCDQGAFSVDEARVILTAAQRAGLGIRLHGDQLAQSGGARLAAELGAASVDHCTYVTGTDLEALAASGTVATLLPTAELFTRTGPTDARRFLDAGVSVAIATDCNPGTSFVTNAVLTLQLAVTQMGLSVAEALYAFTAGGARALARSDVGGLAVGQRAHLALLNGPRYVDLVYRANPQPFRRVLTF
jgi:imidazolonepropionase